jgi:hypothetical protein
MRNAHQAGNMLSYTTSKAFVLTVSKLCRRLFLFEVVQCDVPLHWCTLHACTRRLASLVVICASNSTRVDRLQCHSA